MKLSKNVPLIYIIGSLMWGRFFIPVLALFYIASQVTLIQFSFIMSAFALSTLLLEIPSGIIADLLGKRRTLILARSMYVIEIFLIAFYNGFWVFLIAKIISGIGVSLSSGTGSALLFDTLKRQKRESEHKKISGKLHTITNISMAVVFIIGAYLFSIHYKLPALVSLPFIITGFILTFFLEEPYKNNKNLNLKNSILHLKESLSYFKNSDFVKYISYFSLFTVGAISIALSFSSIYLEKISIPLGLIGVVAFISSMITAYSSKKAYNVESTLGEKKSLRLIQILIITGLLLMSLMVNYFGVIFYLIIAMVSGFFGVIINDYVNHHIETSHRATLLSVKNFFNNMGIFLLFPLFGYLTEIKSMRFSFLGLVLIVLLGYVSLYLYSRNLNISFKKNI